MARYNIFIISGLFIVFSFFPLLSFSQSEVSLIPKPHHLAVGSGVYRISPGLPVHTAERFAAVAELLAELPGVDSVQVMRIRSVRRIPDVGVRLVEATESHKLTKGAYRLQIDAKGILLIAHDEQAIVNGILTLMQLSYLQEDYDVLPCLVVEDQPKYAYRGLHLDVSTHFYPVSFLKKFIDLMAIYKFNRLHWQLTGGAGWRLELSKYPELTKKAAWRTHQSWSEWTTYGSRFLKEGDPNAIGGYYTQRDVKELVAYAKKRGIDIIPDVKIAGLNHALLAVFSEFGCKDEQDGASRRVCLSNDAVFTFTKYVLDEVVALFPSPYIHVGGESVDVVLGCATCDVVEVLNSEGEYIGRVNEYLKTKGRKLIGWDGIALNGLPEGSVLISRRMDSLAVSAVNAGHDVVVASDSKLFFDRYQRDPRIEPKASGGYTTMEMVYQYDFSLEGVAGDKVGHVIGAQASVPTWFMSTADQVEYMVFPRALALAEILWKDKTVKDWDDFNKRLKNHYRILQRLDVNYNRPSYSVDIRVKYNEEQKTNTVSLISEQDESTIRYAVDGSDPEGSSPVYSKTFDLPASATIKAASFIGKDRVGPVTSMDVDLHKAIGKKITYNTEWIETFAAQNVGTLVNGQKGKFRYDDGQWQGFSGDLDVVIDFERREEIKKISMDFIGMAEHQIYPPAEVKIMLSDNGKNYREIAIIAPNATAEELSLFFQTFEHVFEKPYAARYLRIVAPHSSKGIMMTDEIVVY